MAAYNLVLKMPLDTNQPTTRTTSNTFVLKIKSVCLGAPNLADR